MKKITLLLVAALFSALSFGAVPRVMAYDLKSEKNTPAKGFTKFTFSTNTKPTKAYLIFYHAGNEVYRKDITTQAQKQLKNATYTIRTSDLPELTNMKWAIEVQGDAIAKFECTNDVSGTTTKYKFNRPQGVAIDNNTESDFFGRMYIALPKGGYDHTKGIVVFDPVHNVLSNGGITATDVTLGDDDRVGMHRIAVDPITNKVYYAKSESPTAVYELTPDDTNILSDGGMAKNIVDGLGFTRVDAICFDTDGTMFVMDNCNTSTGGTLYKVKNGVKTKILQNGIWGVTDIGMAPDGKGGIWIAQNRGTVTTDNLAALSHVNANGEADYVINKNATDEMKALCPNNNGNAGFRGQCAYNAEENILAFGGNYMVTLFKVTYDSNNKPSLTRWKDTGKLTKNIDGLAFDHAGNLVVMSAQSECFYHYTVPTTTNSCTTPAKSTMQVDGPPTCRVLPHDLTVVNNGNSYTFKYKTNTNAQSGYLVFYKEDGKTVDQKIALPTPIQRNVINQITVAKSALPKRHGITWGIELTGKAVPKYSYLQEITDQTREIYDFYNMMGVLVDNNPESDYFGKIYIQATLTGKSDGATTRADNQKAGLFIYNQWLDELNPTSNVGIQPSLPSGYSIGSANQFNRLAIDPTTNNITYCYAVSGQPAVFSMDRANLTGVPTNLLAGQTGITRSVAHCFDADGNLYVMNLPGSGQIFKIDKNGTKTTFGASTSKYVATNISLAADGRGGLWVAQNRGQIDTYYQLVHYNASGKIDFSVYQGNEHGFTGNSTRGALAYDAERQILAQGRNGSVILFDVTYNASGVPTLTQQSVTASIAHNNIDGLAFDYAGDLYVVNSGKEKFYKFTVPTDNNTCLVPAKKALTVDGNVVAYELNGGQWNEYGWASKKDMYNAFIADWKAYSGSTRGTIPYEDQLGIGKSNGGIPTTIQDGEDILEFMAQEKWAWLAQFLDALATEQGKTTKPTEATRQMRYGLGNFFGEDNNGALNWIGAVDCSAGQADAEEFQPMWGHILSNPTQPTTTMVLGDPFRKGYRFDGWYTSATFSGTAVTSVDENTDGTLYAKWIEHFYTRSVTNGNYGTICLPYGSSDYSGAEFYEIAYLQLASDGTPANIYLDQVIKLEAGIPYIFKATDSELVVYYEGAEELTPVAGKAGLTGTFEAIPSTNDILEGNYMIAQNKFWLCAAGCWLDANRAYIEHDALHARTTPVAPMPGRRRVSMGAAGENAATGSEDIMMPISNSKTMKIIENGQVIIIRDGEKYNMQGMKIAEN